MKITEFYHIGVQVPELDLMGLAKTVYADCYVPSLQWVNSVPFQCRMNTFGGYSWVASNPSACELPEFSTPTIEMIEKLSNSEFVSPKCTLYDILEQILSSSDAFHKYAHCFVYSGPIYCSMRVFLFYGYLLRDAIPLNQRLREVTKRLVTECVDYRKHWIYLNARIDYLRLIDLIFISLRKFSQHNMPTFE
ncbi:hypothetical protein FBUS_02142 [Fasciolopsis buskii]|uniref:Uncharacterized protein n=1 Tax=Fasciolopsis buskii TaxID=27845 RepID=A0A8E0S3C4_9TREM|nr:hypothetical protein FBUS_02142 [Fasciolopsis buski]